MIRLQINSEKCSSAVMAGKCNGEECLRFCERVNGTSCIFKVGKKRLTCLQCLSNNLSCAFGAYSKYSSFGNFLENKPSSQEIKFLVCNEDVAALQVKETHLSIDRKRCISCGACFFRCPYRLIAIDPQYRSQICSPTECQYVSKCIDNCVGKALRIVTENQSEIVETKSFEIPQSIIEKVKQFFKGKKIDVPALFSLEQKCSSLEQFTSTKETSHLIPWAICMLQTLCDDQDARFANELHIETIENPRDARVDICAKNYNEVVIVESKVSLSKLLAEDRYRIQLPLYKKEGERITIDYNESANEDISTTVLLLVGGKESDLFPPDHQECTSRTGNQAATFYQHLSDHRIQFVSANALWALCWHKICLDKADLWNYVLKNIFRDSQENLGLLTAGIVKRQDRYRYLITPIK